MQARGDSEIKGEQDPVHGVGTQVCVKCRCIKEWYASLSLVWSWSPNFDSTIDYTEHFDSCVCVYQCLCACFSGL